MFLDAQVATSVSAWVGSRMYRGDDIYLFDYWPLDDHNIVGGGVFYRKDLRSAGAGREDRRARDRGARSASTASNMPFQYQEIEVANPGAGRDDGRPAQSPAHRSRARPPRTS